MSKEKINIGDKVQAKKFSPFEHDFTGTIEKIYDHSVLVLISDYDSNDEAAVNEMNKRVILKKEDVTVISSKQNNSNSKQKEEK